MEGSQARPACPSDKHNMQMKITVQHGQQNDYCNENEFQMTEPHNRKSNDCDCLKFVTSLRGRPFKLRAPGARNSSYVTAMKHCGNDDDAEKPSTDDKKCKNAFISSAPRYPKGFAVLEGSQVSPARPSGWSSMKMKNATNETLQW